MPVDTVNGGCVLNPPLFTSIACGDEICGTSGAVGGQLDVDVFAIELTAPGRINWEVTPDFPAKIGMVEYQTEFQGSGDCDDMTGASNPIVSVSAGQTGSVTTICLPVGIYYLFVVPQSGADFPCGAQYRAKASCQAGCAGACCFANLSCSSVVTQTLCVFFGGFFGGEGTSCTPPCGSAQAGNCCVANCTASCQDADCCQAVCAVDPFCCINSWDGICAIRAGNFPAQCGCP
jgi:hypothetical protein